MTQPIESLTCSCRSVCRNDHGATALEYLVITSVIALAGVAAFASLGSRVEMAFRGQPSVGATGPGTTVPSTIGVGGRRGGEVLGAGGGEPEGAFVPPGGSFRALGGGGSPGGTVGGVGGGEARGNGGAVQGAGGPLGGSGQAPGHGAVQAAGSALGGSGDAFGFGQPGSAAQGGDPGHAALPGETAPVGSRAPIGRTGEEGESTGGVDGTSAGIGPAPTSSGADIGAVGPGGVGAELPDSTSAVVDGALVDGALVDGAFTGGDGAIGDAAGPLAEGESEEPLAFAGLTVSGTGAWDEGAYGVSAEGSFNECRWFCSDPAWIVDRWDDLHDAKDSVNEGLFDTINGGVDDGFGWLDGKLEDHGIADLRLPGTGPSVGDALDFSHGIVDGTLGIVEGLVFLSELQSDIFLLEPDLIRGLFEFSDTVAEDPGVLRELAVDTIRAEIEPWRECVAEQSYYDCGTLVPDIAISIATGGSGKGTTILSRLRGIVQRRGRKPKATTDSPEGPHGRPESDAGGNGDPDRDTPDDRGNGDADQDTPDDAPPHEGRWTASRGDILEGIPEERIIEDGLPEYVIYERSDGSRGIRFRADDANLGNHPTPATNRTDYAEAGIDENGDVRVIEGYHRTAAAAQGQTIPSDLGGVPSAPGYLDYDYVDPAQFGLEALTPGTVRAVDAELNPLEVQEELRDAMDAGQPMPPSAVIPPPPPPGAGTHPSTPGGSTPGTQTSPVDGPPPPPTTIRGPPDAPRDITFSDRQIQKKFKHAEDFGVEGNYNRTTAGEFRAAIGDHIDAPGTQRINGTYRGDPVVHHLDPNTGLNVVEDASGNFVSGWRLSPDQLENVVTRGSL
ncbi:MAG: colicin D domain-containing protein [Myxococcota bacterium]